MPIQPLAPNKSWGYPDFGYTKLFGVPLFSGFMYASIGSYIIQAWRPFGLRVLRARAVRPVDCCFPAPGHIPP